MYSVRSGFGEKSYLDPSFRFCHSSELDQTLKVLDLRICPFCQIDQTYQIGIFIFQSSQYCCNISHFTFLLFFIIHRIYLYNNEVRDDFLTLIPVTKTDHQTLYEAIVNYFEKMNIPYKMNMIGFGSDGASNMFGQYNSVIKKLKDDITHLFVMRCRYVSFACKHVKMF